MTYGRYERRLGRKYFLFGFGVGFKIGVGVALVLASEWASILK